MIVSGKSKANIDKAVALIRSGDIVAFPTETVYGLGADALNLEGVQKIFVAKGRPSTDPLIVHVADQAQLNMVAAEVPDSALKLISKFWPGPLTLVLKKNKSVPDEVTAGLDTVAVRMPRNLIALALIKNSNRVIAAPSANKFQSMSPTTAEAVEAELGGEVSLILDGGPCQVGVESTVLSLVDGPLLLRPGGVSLEDLEDVLECKIPVAQASKKHEAQMAPGMLDFHYAPKKSLSLFDLTELEKHIKGRAVKHKLGQTALLCFSKVEKKRFEEAGFREIAVLSLRGNLDEAAQNLFSSLRKLDEGGCSAIFALEVPNERLGLAINDRLKKAKHQ